MSPVRMRFCSMCVSCRVHRQSEVLRFIVVLGRINNIFKMSDPQERKLKDLQMKSASNPKIAETGDRDRDSSQERKMREMKMKSAISQKLVESGERERLKELLRTRLVESGWRDQLKAHCKEIVKEKGVENVTVDDLVAEITAKGRELVPDSVKRELLQRIRTFLSQHANV